MVGVVVVPGVWTCLPWLYYGSYYSDGREEMGGGAIAPGHYLPCQWLLILLIPAMPLQWCEEGGEADQLLWPILFQLLNVTLPDWSDPRYNHPHPFIWWYIPVGVLMSGGCIPTAVTGVFCCSRWMTPTVLPLIHSTCWLTMIFWYSLQDLLLLLVLWYLPLLVKDIPLVLWKTLFWGLLWLFTTLSHSITAIFIVGDGEKIVDHWYSPKWRLVVTDSLLGIQWWPGVEKNVVMCSLPQRTFSIQFVSTIGLRGLC